MIVFEDVTKDYKGGNHALKHVNLRIRKGDFVFVLGHSGAGKSTFIKLILREEQATSGRVLVDGLDLSVMKKRKVPYLRRRMGVVFQDFRLIPTMSVYENVAFAMRVTNIAEDKIKKRVSAFSPISGGFAAKYCCERFSLSPAKSIRRSPYCTISMADWSFTPQEDLWY